MPISPGIHLLYAVRPGDTLYSIAEQLGTNVPSLVQLNSLYAPVADPDRIYPGQVLLARLPGMAEQSSVLYQVQPGDTLYRIAERFSLGVDMLAGLQPIAAAGLSSGGPTAVRGRLRVRGEPGDSLYRISRRFGTTMSELVRANQNRPGLSPDGIYPGFRLVIPLPSSINIVVFQPLPGTRIAFGQHMAGLARAFEARPLHPHLLAREGDAQLDDMISRIPRSCSSLSYRLSSICRIAAAAASSSVSPRRAFLNARMMPFFRGFLGISMTSYRPYPLSRFDFTSYRSSSPISSPSTDWFNGCTLGDRQGICRLCGQRFLYWQEFQTGQRICA